MMLKVLRKMEFSAQPTREPGPGIVDIYRRHAARAISEGRWASAGIFFDKMLDVNPHNTEAWLMKAHLLRFCSDDPETALEYYRKVISLCGYDPDHPHLQRARKAMASLLERWA